MLCSYKGGGRGAIALYFYVQLTKVNSISDKVTGGRGAGGGAGSRHFWERPRTHDWRPWEAQGSTKEVWGSPSLLLWAT